MRNELLNYFKAMIEANELRIRLDFIEDTVLDILDRLSKGELLGSRDFEILKDTSNATTQKVLENVFGIKMTKTQYKNHNILQEYTYGKKIPVIDTQELSEMKKVTYVKRKVKDYVITNIHSTEVHSRKHIVFDMETRYGIKKFGFELEHEKDSSEGYVWLVECYVDYHNRERNDRTVSDKFLSTMDMKLIKEYVRKTEAYQIEYTTLRLQKLFT